MEALRCFPPPDASLRARGSIEGEGPTIMGLPIGAALWAASRAAAPTAYQASAAVRRCSICAARKGGCKVLQG